MEHHSQASYIKGRASYNNLLAATCLTHPILDILRMRASLHRLLPFITLCCSLFVCEALGEGDAFNVDLTAGFDLQAATSKEPATALEYTDEGGVLHFNPYDAQRIGSDGMQGYGGDIS